MSSKIDLNGYRVMLFGASSGIGVAVARVFAKCGARLCLHYNSNRGAAEKLADEIAEQGGTAHPVGGDLTTPGVGADVVRAAIEALGGLDVLVNNAGALIGRTPLADFDPGIYEAAFMLNTRAMLDASRAGYPALKDSPRAAIINVGSIAARNGGAAGSGLYAASKAAVHSLTRSMASEFASDGIRVNAIAPGFIATPFHDGTPADRREAARKSIPMGRLGTAEDCAWAFAFLASKEMSGYITGQILDINGGQIMP